MNDLKRLRARLMIIAAMLALLDIAAVALLLTPIAGSGYTRQQELRRLWLQVKQRESAPWKGLEKKLPAARLQIEDFYRDRLPGGYSVISAELAKVALQSGVKMAAEKYAQKDADLPGLQKIEAEAEVSGDYRQIVQFINSLERDKVFFILNDLQLAGEQNGIVKLQIKLETYLRTV